jgi:hypothetical protein
MILGRIRYVGATGTLVVGLGLGCISSAQNQSAAHAPDPMRGAVIAAQGTAAR